MFSKTNITGSETDHASDLVGIGSEELAAIKIDSASKEVSVMALLATAQAPVSWSFEDFIVEGDQVMIAGAPKSGKSWLALQLALAAASGGRFLRWRATRKLKTLYLNLEVGEQMWARRVMKQIGAPSSILFYADHFFTRSDLRTFDIMDPVQRRQLADMIKAGGYEFVVIDVLSRCHYADENDNGIMKQVLVSLRAMCGNATHVVVHHARKPPPGSEHVNLGTASIRGASAIAGEVDLAMSLVVRSGQGARYSLTMAARNVPEPEEMLLDRNDEDMLYFEQTGDSNQLEDVIRAAFRNRGELPRTELQKALADGLGVALDSARRHIKEAESRGFIESEKRGKYIYYAIPEDAPFLRVAQTASDCPF
jgi:DNA-binding transcriptional ArsR family regulator